VEMARRSSAANGIVLAFSVEGGWYSQLSSLEVPHASRESKLHAGNSEVITFL
jgi:hypothetical protein